MNVRSVTQHGGSGGILALKFKRGKCGRSTTKGATVNFIARVLNSELK